MKRKKNIWILTPVFGAILFAILYIIATFFYPGGSQADNHSTGFSWANNYWCNLLNENAINGQHNPARPIAMTGMFVLCLTLVFFWFLFPVYMSMGKITRRVVQISGTIAMAVAFLLLTNTDHDLVIDLAAGFGLIATAGIFTGLYKAKWYGLFAFGLLNILLVVLNNYFYYTKGLIIYLPILQKITFASFLTWVCFIDINLYHRSKMKKAKQDQNIR